MLKLAITVIAIALPDSINPTLIGGELFVATGSRPGRRATVFTLAALGVTFVFGLVFAIGLGDLILSIVPKPGPTVKYALITAAGAVLTAGGAVVLIRRHSIARSQASGARSRLHGSAGWIGAGLAGVELLTAFPYFAAIALIVGSRVAVPGKVFLLLLYSAVYTLPLIAIAAVCVFTGDRAEAILKPVGDWLLAHWPMVVGPLTLIIGIGVLTLGIVQLT